jgi:enamine deaminase RidA (YjgF/YER057c/UK114 family)
MPAMTNGLSQITHHALDGARHTTVRVSRFLGTSGVAEYHLMVCPTAYGTIVEQLAWVDDAYREGLDVLGLDVGGVVFRRFFCSDLPNQAAVLDAYPPATRAEACAVSRVCQPPAPPAKVALWAYHIADPNGPLDKVRDGDTLALTRGARTHRWTTGLISPRAGSSAEQTRAVLEQYAAGLRARGLNLADHVLRTWFFVRGVDTHYQGLVEARRAFFALHGLTPETHFIASTGIEGSSADIDATVMLDAYAVAGVQPEQVRYLSAPDHLCPTHVYGVTFERGVAVHYRDRSRISISGTASIDADGHIVHPGDVRRQLDRTLANIDALLQDAGAALADVALYIVYVRDISDAQLVQSLMDARVGHTPVQVVVAPVCRPGWLVEVECEAIIPARYDGLPAF